MGLLAHWPLNGNTNDTTGNGYNGSIIGTLNTTDGKIGSTYIFTNTNNGVNINNNFVGLRQYTMTAWINPAGNHRNYEGAIISSGNWNTTQWVFGLKQDNTAIDVAGPGYLNYINYNVPLNTWTHVATTVADGLAKLYVNGSYIGERNIGSSLVSDASNTCIGRETYADGYFAFNGLINDVRIYDHTLSSTEVQEIARTKILHYNFNEFQEPTTNYIANGNFPGGAAPGNETYTSGTKSIVTGISNPVNGTHVLKNNQTGGAISEYNIYIPNINAGGQITYSAWVWVSSDYNGSGFLHSRWWNTGGSVITAPAPGNVPTERNQWVRISNTIDLGANIVSYGYWYFGYPFQATAGYVYVTGFQLENKSYETPFVNGSRAGTIQDKGLFGNNATLALSTTPQWTPTSKLGSGSYTFSTGKRIITPNINLGNGSLPWTVSAWVKTTTTTDGLGNGSILSNQSSGPVTSALSINAGKIAYWIYGGSWNRSLGSTTVNDNNWHLLTWVNNSNSTMNMYVDGVLDGVVSNSTATNNNPVDIVGASWSASFSGTIDDFRIYHSALSSSEVLDLYKTRAEIVNSGRLFARHIDINTNYDQTIENTNLVLNGDGSFGDLTNWSGVFDGWDASQNAFYATGSYRTLLSNNFIEVKGNGINVFDQYVIDAEHKQPSGPTSYYYFMIACYDKDKNFIGNEFVTEYTGGTRTTLAQTLNPGDSVLYLTSASNWSTLGGGVDHYTQQFAIFPNGHPYPDYTYSRIHASYKSISGNTLTLNSPWSGATMPAGSRIMNTTYGGTFSYIGGAYVPMTTDWVRRTATTSAGIDNGNMRAGSKYFKIGWLLDYNGTGTTSYFRNIKVYNITNPNQATMFTTDDFEITDKSFKVQDYSLTGVSRDLIGHWPLEKDTLDISGYNRHGTAYGATPQGESYYFDGVNDTISFGTGATFFPLNSHTISVMFASDGTTATTGTYPCLFGFTYGIRGLLGSAGSPEYALFKTNGNTYVNSGVSGLHDSQWHMFTATCDGSIIKIYVDGEYKAQGNVSSFWDGSTSWPGDTWNIGRDNNNGFYHFRGRMKQLKLFSRALSADEIKLEYNTMLNNEVQISKEGVLYAKEVIEY